MPRPCVLVVLLLVAAARHAEPSELPDPGVCVDELEASVRGEAESDEAILASGARNRPGVRTVTELECESSDPKVHHDGIKCATAGSFAFEASDDGDMAALATALAWQRRACELGRAQGCFDAAILELLAGEQPGKPESLVHVQTYLARCAGGECIEGERRPRLDLLVRQCANAGAGCQVLEGIYAKGALDELPPRLARKIRALVVQPCDANQHECAARWEARADAQLATRHAKRSDEANAFRRASVLYRQACEAAPERGDACVKLAVKEQAMNGGVAVGARRTTWLRRLVDRCRGGDCTHLAHTLHQGASVVGGAARQFVSNRSTTQCAAALYEASCSAGNPQACATLGNMYLRGSGSFLPLDRARAMHFLSAECKLRGGDCSQVVPHVRTQFYARHLLALSASFGFEGAGDDVTTNPLGVEVALIRFLGDWIPTGQNRGTVFGVGAAAQAEYAFGGHPRIGGNLTAVLWTMKLRTGYMTELDQMGTTRRDLRFELAMSAPWVQAPLRLAFRLDVPVDSRDDAGVRGGFFVELGHNFGLDGRAPRLRDFGFPLIF